MSNSKRIPKFNIVDGLVILAVIVVIAAAVWFFAGASPGNERYVYFVVEFQEQMPDFMDNITAGNAPGAEVRDSIRNYFLGHVQHYEKRPAVLITFDNTINEFISTTIPDRYDVYVTIRGAGTENESAILTNGHIVRVGQEMFIVGHGFAGIGFITQIWTTAR
jgi:hypothetical protein